MKKLLAAALIPLAFCRCSSAPKKPEAPEWVHGPTRIVDGGFIVYIGSGEDHVLEKARFKAEGMALQDLANECSFAPKGTRIEDHYDELEGLVHPSYVKIAVEFQDCENAKKATSPEEIRTLANQPLTEELKLYQQEVDAPEPEESQPLVVAENAPPPPPGGGSSTVYFYSGPPVTYAQFYVYRQQVAYVKEDVILAPPTAYPPAEPKTVHPIPSLTYANQNVHQFEQTHPELATGHQAFSNQRPNWSNHQASALRNGRANAARKIAPAPHAQNSPHFSPGNGGKRASGGGNGASSGRKRRRRGGEQSH